MDDSNPDVPTAADHRLPQAPPAALPAEVTAAFDRIFAIFQADIAAPPTLSIGTRPAHSAQRARSLLS